MFLFDCKWLSHQVSFCNLHSRILLENWSGAVVLQRTSRDGWNNDKLFPTLTEGGWEPKERRKRGLNRGFSWYLLTSASCFHCKHKVFFDLIDSRLTRAWNFRGGRKQRRKWRSSLPRRQCGIFNLIFSRGSVSLETRRSRVRTGGPNFRKSTRELVESPRPVL